MVVCRWSQGFENLKYSRKSEEINQGDNEKMTPLHWAVANNRISHLEYMLLKKYGIDTSVTDIEGYACICTLC